MKKVLMLNASYVDEPLILALKDLGCYVITTGTREDFPGHKLADEYVFADFSDKELILEIAREKGVDAVCPCGSDFGVLTAAYVSEKLGIKGQDSYDNALILHEKDRFKKYANEKDWLNSPKAMYFEQVEQALEWSRKDISYPVIVKPVDLASGTGVCKVDSKDQMDMAIRTAFEKSRKKHIVVEPFIEGTEHAICTFLIDEKVALYCTNDENTFVNPYRIEVARFPASHSKNVEMQLIEQIERMAQDLHLADGIFHVQYIVKDDRAYIIECMRRVLGNLYSVPAGDSLGGFDWEKWIVKSFCGFGVEGFPKGKTQKGFYTYRALFASKNGKYKQVNIAEDVKPFIYRKKELQPIGHVIENYLSDSVGIVFMRFDDIETMEKVSVDNYGKISVEIEGDNYE